MLVKGVPGVKNINKIKASTFFRGIQENYLVDTINNELISFRYMWNCDIGFANYISQKNETAEGSDHYKSILMIRKIKHSSRFGTILFSQQFIKNS